MKDPFSNSDSITPNDTAQYCSICGGRVSNIFQSGTDTCPNCGTSNCVTYEGGIPPHAPEKKKPFNGNNPTFINKNKPVNTAQNKMSYSSEIDKDKEYAKDDDDTIKDVYTVEFDACKMIGVDEERKSRLSVDERKEDVMKSCADLAIDG